MRISRGDHSRRPRCLYFTNERAAHGVVDRQDNRR
jgi:hypothetical protein